MVEKPVRNSEFCISCTMPERLAFTTSRSTASTCISGLLSGRLRLSPIPSCPAPCRASTSFFASTSKTWMAGTSPAMTRWRDFGFSFVLRHDQVFPFVDPRGLPRTYYRRAIELVEHGGTGESQAHVELLTLIDRAVDRLAVETHLACLAQCVFQSGPLALELRHFHRRHQADAT